MTTEADVRVTLRIPPAVYEKIVQTAERDRRSINGQIVWMLEHATHLPQSLAVLNEVFKLHPELLEGLPKVKVGHPPSEVDPESGNT